MIVFMKVLIACEFSGVVRDAFTRRGHNAISCDLLPSETPGKHYQGDVFDIIDCGFDMMIAHPPCTYLCCSGARWFASRMQLQSDAIEFALKLYQSNIKRIAIENPIGVLSSKFRKPDQIVQPWQFGHGETKATCLWLKNVPPLFSSDLVSGREARIHRMPPSKDRSKERSRTFTGIAEAMADQWGSIGIKTQLDIRTVSH